MLIVCNISGNTRVPPENQEICKEAGKLEQTTQKATDGINRSKYIFS